MTIENVSIAVSHDMDPKAKDSIKRAEDEVNRIVGQVNDRALFLDDPAPALASLALTGALTGNGAVHAHATTAVPAGGTAGAGILMSSDTNRGIFFGSGAPTLNAAKGSFYMRSDGSGTSNRMYINTDGATAWTAVTTAA